MVDKYDNYELRKVSSLENRPGTIKDGDGYIWDPSGLPDNDFDVSKVPLEYRRLATWMRSKLFGKDVRETIARFVELSGVIDDRQKSVESFLVDFIQSATEAEIVSGPEIVQARGGKDTLGQRLDDSDAQLAQKAQKDVVNTISGQIDNLIANAGNTDGNAELLDIRVGLDGVTYPTAGDAVRSIQQFMTEENQNWSVN